MSDSKASCSCPAIHQPPDDRIACEALASDIVLLYSVAASKELSCFQNHFPSESIESGALGFRRIVGMKEPHAVHAKLQGTFENCIVKLPGLPPSVHVLSVTIYHSSSCQSIHFYLSIVVITRQNELRI